MRYILVFTIALFLSTPTYAQDTQESVYDRVMRTGTIRCGYLPAADFLEVDPNTGEISGLTYDYMETIAQNLGLKVEWAEEIGRGDYIAALQNNRFDAYCTALSINAERAREVDFVTPYTFDAFEFYAREGDMRFDNNLDAINSEGVKVVTIEGDIFGKIVRKSFPNATLIELPQLSGETDPLLHVATEKADTVLINISPAKRYMKNNPDKIRMVKLNRPYMYNFASVSVKADEYRFRRMLDLATFEIIGNGQLRAAYEKNNVLDLLRFPDHPYLEGK